MTDVFTHIEDYQIKTQLEELYSDCNSIINMLPYSGKYYDTYMAKQFCNGYQLKTISCQPEVKNTVSKGKDIVKPLYKQPAKVTLNQIDISEPRITEVSKKIDSPKVANTIQYSPILKSLSEINSNFYIEKIVKEGDYLSIAVFTYLSNIFSISTLSDKNDMLKKIKLDIITKFNKENYYRDYDYSLKHFKKSVADEIFSNNLNITVNMLKIYGDILNINVVYINEDNIEFITKYNQNNATLVINNTSHSIFILMTKDEFIRGDVCKDILGINKKYKEETLLKFKLGQLQNLAKMKNLDIKKAGKTGKINITIQELSTLICNN